MDGNQGGESEAIIGRWLAERGNRDDVLIATKCGAMPARKGLRAGTVKQACEDSLARLARQPTILAPIASARTPEQLADLLAVRDVTLSDAQLERLTAASG